VTSGAASRGDFLWQVIPVTRLAVLAPDPTGLVLKDLASGVGLETVQRADGAFAGECYLA